MASITSTYQLGNYYTEDTELFTEYEANNSVILYTKKVSRNTVFDHWEMQVQDNLGNIYTWKDFVTVEGAIKSAVKIAIYRHLLNTVKAQEDGNNDGYLETVVTPSDRGQDEYVGD
jgi:hypothetical protein